ncbi:MAG TPA: hypothetical protein VGB45_02605 [Abditibacterium sp.]|jgi:hypothetical protein
MAVTFDFGKCGACGESNSKSIQQCRACGAPLPWAKSAPAASSGGLKIGDSKIGLGDVAWAAMGVQILGGVIFLAGCFFWAGNMLRFYPTFPGLGYILLVIGGGIWGVGSNMD